ncbi:hypothetical protein ACWD4O_39395 [Streptomyces sp. NPDC002623]
MIHAAPDRAEPLVRRRRHAWLLVALTELIGDCAQAAGEVYGPVAEARPAQTDVPVHLEPLADLCRSAGTRVDTARARDAARRPPSVTGEKEEAERLTPCAADTLADAGSDFLTELLDVPAQAGRRAQELASAGGFTVDQILDEAADTAVLSGLLSLHEAQRQSDPSTAAAKCLAAAGHFALAVSVVSVDVPAATP